MQVYVLVLVECYFCQKTIGGTFKANCASLVLTVYKLADACFCGCQGNLARNFQNSMKLGLQTR